MAAWNSFFVHISTWIWSIVGTNLCRGQGPSGLVPTHFKCLWSWRAHHLWPLQHQPQLKIEKLVWIVQVCTLSKLTFVLVRRPKSYICWCLDGHYLNAHMNRYWNTCKYTKLKLLSLRAFWCFGEESLYSLPRIDINYYYIHEIWRVIIYRASAEKKITQVCFVAIMARWGEKEKKGWFWQNRAGPVCW